MGVRSRGQGLGSKASLLNRVEHSGIRSHYLLWIYAYIYVYKYKYIHIYKTPDENLHLQQYCNHHKSSPEQHLFIIIIYLLILIIIIINIIILIIIIINIISIFHTLIHMKNKYVYDYLSIRTYTSI
jgi:Ca2+/Na+ antiporter